MAADVIRGPTLPDHGPEPAAPRPPELVNRHFTATRPNQPQVADLTHVRTCSGWVYVAFVLDVYSRMIGGWQFAPHMRTDLPLDTPEMALWCGGINKGSGIWGRLRGGRGSGRPIDGRRSRDCPAQPWCGLGVPASVPDLRALLEAG
ncbi:DDE-type integrase/transposase/recombinase [Streptomyces sp. NPDC001435]|uniref:DDE-type integrase/transposase/recombinase n=1 Tax=unclassified Streptomyces TaxID=2593676 RepID=UPI0036C799D4